MRFRNYCLVVMGNNKNIYPEILKIADTKPNFFDAKGITISTFQSIMEINEITEFMKENGRNFLVFDLNPEVAGFNIEKDDIREGLFGFLQEFNEERLKEKTEEFLHGISSTTITNSSVKTSVETEKIIQISVSDIDKMSTTERNNLFDKLIQKGLDKSLNDNDLVLLERLTK